MATGGGYALAIQDMRGRFDSEGKATVFFTDGWGELQDGYDTIEWLASQSWCDGKVGTFGGSALGITQYLAAGASPPHLVCGHAGVAPGDLYKYAVYPGGVFRKADIENWLQTNRFSQDNLDLILSHPDYDSLWEQAAVINRPEKVNIPIFHHGGWYDIFQQGTIDAFLALQERGGPGARGQQHLLIGPWTHGRSRQAGEIRFPPKAFTPPQVDNPMPWFDRWLNGKANGADKWPAVTYYVMGDVDDPSAPGNEWRTSEVWPVPSQPTEWYFHKDGTLSSEPASETEAGLSYKYDPANPVPTRGGTNLRLPGGPMDQRPVENRPDVLLFTSDVLTQPMEVTGRITAHLWISSTAPDTDFTAKLTDVYPDGRSMLLCDGIIRASHRESLARRDPLEPGKVYEVTVDLWSTSIVFNKGHRIRVAVSSSNSPRFEPNPNTGAAHMKDGAPQIATNTLFLDAAHPSHILLPVVNREHLSY